MKTIALTVFFILMAGVQLSTGQDCIDRSSLLTCKIQTENRLNNCLQICNGAFGKKKTSCQLSCYQSQDGFPALAACIN